MCTAVVRRRQEGSEPAGARVTVVRRRVPRDLVLGDRWADLAVASMSLEWNHGPALETCFFDAYGAAADEARIRYFRALWHAES